PAVLAAADHHLRFGPGAGPQGGRLLHSGAPEPARAAPMPTATAGPPTTRPQLVLTGARGRNLKDVTFRAPRGRWTAICGVSGSGKTALITDTLAPAVGAVLGLKAAPLPFDTLKGTAGLLRLLQLDRAPVGRSWRSCTATAVGAWTSIRNLLSSTRASRIRGFGAERFSFNRKGGRCEACHGAGRRKLDLDYLPDATVICEICEGRRFDSATLSVEYRGASVHDILEMSVSDARRHFANQPRILRILTALSDVGLGYLPLGQTADTFSGGEAQRVRLAGELARTGPGDSLAGTLVVLDEPASALHPDDVGPISDSLRRLVSRGATLVTVASTPALLQEADHLVILGPGAGPEGGRIVSEGPPVS
ncbi:MAG: excinuclease ABC subunit A, partial [Myxococcota bacterium]